MSTTPTTTIPAHPKVVASVSTGLALSVLGFIANGLDPALFKPLGIWATPVSMLVTAGAMGLAGWLKRSEAKPAPEPPTPVATSATLTLNEEN